MNNFWSFGMNIQVSGFSFFNTNQNEHVPVAVFTHRFCHLHLQGFSRGYFSTCASSSNSVIFVFYVYNCSMFSHLAFCKLLKHSNHSLQGPSGDDHESWIMGLSCHNDSTNIPSSNLPWPSNNTNELDIHGLVSQTTPPIQGLMLHL